MRGPLGVDALLHRREGALFVKPIVEVNPRRTMGALALGFERWVRPGRVGVWRLLAARDLRGSGAADFASLARRLGAIAPPLRSGAPQRLHAGAVTTNDPSQAEGHLGVLVIGGSVAECVGVLERGGVCGALGG